MASFTDGGLHQVLPAAHCTDATLGWCEEHKVAPSLDAGPQATSAFQMVYNQHI